MSCCLFGAGVPAGGYMGAPMQGYYGQQQNAPQGYYGQPAQTYAPAGMQASPMMNPMQAPAYGVNPAAPNQQFVQQANTMMGGTVYGQAPTYGAPVMNQPVYAAPQAQQPVQTQQNNTQQNAGPVVTPQPDGSVKSESKIDL